jgi:hypothetical protein
MIIYYMKNHVKAKLSNFKTNFHAWMLQVLGFTALPPLSASISTFHSKNPP